MGYTITSGGIAIGMNATDTFETLRRKDSLINFSDAQLQGYIDKLNITVGNRTNNISTQSNLIATGLLRTATPPQSYETQLYQAQSDIVAGVNQFSLGRLPPKDEPVGFIQSYLNKIKGPMVPMVTANPIAAAAARPVLTTIGTSLISSAIVSKIFGKVAGKSINEEVQTMGIYNQLDNYLGGYLPGGITPQMDNAMQGTVGVVKTWDTGTARFARLSDGRMMAQRKDGTVKVYKPYKSLVFGKKLNVGGFIRLAHKYKKTHTKLNHIFKGLKRV